MTRAAVQGSKDPESEPSLLSDAESSKDTSSDSESISELDAEDRPYQVERKPSISVNPSICYVM